jgi:ABC-2 type transport system ATP-binding protein
VSNAILLKGVTKTFGSVTAVQNLDLAIPAGALYGFIGPNGAGKTTSIRIIMSIIFPDSGDLSVLGHSSALDAKDRIGYLPEERGVYKKMRVGAFVRFMAQLKGMPDTTARQRAQDLLARVGLESAAQKRCEELSKGMLQKVQLIAAIIHRPDLLILDEPFSGLDPVSARLLREVILDEHKRGATILFSTHVMPHAEDICQNIVMIDRGRKVLDASLADIRRQYDPRAILFEPINPSADLSPIQTLPEVERVERTDSCYEIRLRDGTNSGDAMQRIVMAVAPARIELSRPRLEDIFIQIVSGEQPEIARSVTA